MDLKDLGTLHLAEGEDGATPFITRLFFVGMLGKNHEACEGEHGEPVIKSGLTGRVFRLSWDDILALAIARGVDGDDVSAEAAACGGHKQ